MKDRFLSLCHSTCLGGKIYYNEAATCRVDNVVFEKVFKHLGYQPFVDGLTSFLSFYMHFEVISEPKRRGDCIIVSMLYLRGKTKN